MIDKTHILLLAGSFEARSLAEAMTARGLQYDAWITEPPRGSAPMPVTPQLRRFDRAKDMQQAIGQGGYRAVLDASHVFDRLATKQAFAAAKTMNLPYLRIERPAWATTGHPKTTSAKDVRTATAMIGEGARVFAATGWDSLPDYANFKGEVLMLRQTRRHPRPAPYPFVELAFGDPPFSIDDEKELFASHKIDTLVCRNLGTSASGMKVDAAQALGLHVILIDRPALPQGLEMVTHAADGIAWALNL
ncbi:MAG: precorrin-6A/cobalt-precorrin-6A reductase [Marinomonas sp.]